MIEIKSGVIVWVDGVEGVGKTTLVSKLVQYFKSAYPDKEVASFRFPNDDVLPVRTFVLSRSNDGGDTFAYIANILATCERKILPIIDQGGIVICDRSILTTLSLQLNSEIEPSISVLNLLQRGSALWKKICEVSRFYLITAGHTQIYERLRERGAENERDRLSISEIFTQQICFTQALSMLQTRGGTAHILYADDAYSCIVSTVNMYFGRSTKHSFIKEKLTEAKRYLRNLFA